MAEYRQLKIAFWYSAFVLSLSPEERAFYAFMLTNPLTSHCGVYHLPIKIITVIHGHTEEIITALIQKFVAWKKIEYDPTTHEFFLVNWMKHNRPKNPMTFAHVGKEVVSIKSQELKNRWLQTNPLDAEKVGLPFTLKTTHPPSTGSIETVSRLSTDCYETVQNPEISAIKKDINSSVPGYSSVDYKKEVGCSLLGLKQEEPEHKDQGIQETGRDLLQIDLSLQDKKPEEVHKDQPEEESKSTFFGVSGEDKKKESKPDPKPGSKLDTTTPPEEVILRYMNRKLCTGYHLDSANIREIIGRKMAEGFTVQDFLIVIDKKFADWQNPPFRSNLVPHVLFGDKFETYLQQSPREDKKKAGLGERMPVSAFNNHTREIVEVF